MDTNLIEKNYQVIEISAKSSVTRQLNDVWYKMEFTETRKILNDVDIEKQRENLWNCINDEIYNQDKELFNSLNIKT